jgi:hypothetical protein
MLPEDIPCCRICNSPAIKGAGGTFAPGLNQQSFRCVSCNASIQLLQHPSGAIIAYIARDICIQNPEYPDEWRFPEEYGTWANDVLLVTWRHREAEFKAHEDAEWVKWLAEVFYVRFPDLKGHLPEKHAAEGWPSPFTDSTIAYHDCPQEAQDEHDNQFWKGDSSHSSGKDVGSYLPLPEHLKEPVYPPRLPPLSGLEVLYWDGAGWEPVSSSLSWDQEVPEDPIITRNRDFFDAVWVGVEEGIGCDLPPRSETENRYGGKEPWYTFDLGDYTMTAGWRHRVVSIKVESNGSATIPTEALKALADRDKVTFTTYGPKTLMTAESLEAEIREEEPDLPENQLKAAINAFRENHPDGKMMEPIRSADLSHAHKIIIHAWGKDKTIEYLIAACKTVAEAAEVSRGEATA